MCYYQRGPSCLMNLRAFYLGEMFWSEFYVGRGCSAPVQLIRCRDKSSAASNPRSSQHSPANKLEYIFKKNVIIETFYIKYYSMIKIICTHGFQPLTVRYKSPTCDKQTATNCVCHSRCVVAMLQKMRTVRCNRKWTIKVQENHRENFGM